MASSSSKNGWGVKRSDSDIRYHGTNQNSQAQSPTAAGALPPTSSRTSLGFSDEEVEDLFSSVETKNQGRDFTGTDARSEHLVINSGALVKRLESVGSDVSKTVEIKVYQPKDAEEPIHTEVLTITTGITEVELRLAPERGTAKSDSNDQTTRTETSETSTETIIEITTRTKSTAAVNQERRGQDAWTSVESSAKIGQQSSKKVARKYSEMEPNSDPRDRDGSTDSTKSESKKDAKSFNGVSFESPPTPKKKTSTRDSESRRRTSGPPAFQQKKRSSAGSNRSGSEAGSSDFDDLVMLPDNSKGANGKEKEENPSTMGTDEESEEEEGCQNPCCCYCNQDFANYCWFQPYSQGQGWCQNLQGEADSSQPENGPNGSRPSSRGNQNQRKGSQRNSRAEDSKNPNCYYPDPCCWDSSQSRPNSASNGKRPSQGGQNQQGCCNMMQQFCNSPEPDSQNPGAEQEESEPEPSIVQEEEQEEDTDDEDSEKNDDDDEESEAPEE